LHGESNEGENKMKTSIAQIKLAIKEMTALFNQYLAAENLFSRLGNKSTAAEMKKKALELDARICVQEDLLAAAEKQEIVIVEVEVVSAAAAKKIEKQEAEITFLEKQLSRLQNTLSNIAGMLGGDIFCYGPLAKQLALDALG
jgi:hypothetical protein